MRRERATELPLSFLFSSSPSTCLPLGTYLLFSPLALAVGVLTLQHLKLVSFKARPVLRPGTAYPPAAHYPLFSPPLSLFVTNFIIYQLSRFNPYKPCLTAPYTLPYSPVQCSIVPVAETKPTQPTAISALLLAVH